MRLFAACGIGFSLALSAVATAQSTNLYWGDTHLHTGNSFDVYLFGTPTATPDTAYRFAKGNTASRPSASATD